VPFDAGTLRIRQAAYGLSSLIRPSSDPEERPNMYRAVVRWNKLLDPVRFVTEGAELNIG
jgi:hypothetical protein